MNEPQHSTTTPPPDMPPVPAIDGQPQADDSAGDGKKNETATDPAEDSGKVLADENEETDRPQLPTLSCVLPRSTGAWDTTSSTSFPALPPTKPFPPTSNRQQTPTNRRLGSPKPRNAAISAAATNESNSKCAVRQHRPTMPPMSPPTIQPNSFRQRVQTLGQARDNA